MPRKPKPEVVPPGTTDVGPKVMADEQSAPPALFQHALKTYEAMLIKAKEVSTTEGVLVVYEGKLTDLITKELYLSTPYYTSITRVLKAMGCIQQLKRGGGSAPSQWLMVKMPTLEDFTQHEEDNPGATKLNRYDRRPATRLEMEEMKQTVAALRDQIRTLERKIQTIARVIPDEWIDAVEGKSDD